jgi:hypothetical protein
MQFKYSYNNERTNKSTQINSAVGTDILKKREMETLN